MVKGRAEFLPYKPGGVNGRSAGGADSQGGIFLNKEEFMCDSRAEPGWASVQDGGMGYGCCTACKKSRSIKWKEQELKLARVLEESGLYTADKVKLLWWADWARL